MKLFLPSTAFVIAISAFAPFASGQTLYWDGGTSGEFNNENNWSTVPPNVNFNTSTSGTPGIPGPSTIAIIDADINNGSVTTDVTFGITNTPLAITLSSETPGHNVVQGLVVSNYFFFGAPTGSVSLTNTSGTALTITGSGTPTGDFLVDGYETFTYTGALRMNTGTAVVGDDSFENVGSEPGTGDLVLNTGTYNFDPATGQDTQMIVGYSQEGSTNGFLIGGASGTVTQSANATTTGNLLVLGYNGGSGSWNVTNGSTLQTGSQAGVSYVIQLGVNGGVSGATALGTSGSDGTLTISDTSVVNLTLNSDLQVGTVAAGALAGTVGGTGVINQNDNSVVNIGGASTVELGDGGGSSSAYGGGEGTWNLNGGTLNISSSGDFIVGAFGSTTDLASGTLNQSGTSVLNDTGTGAFIVGNSTTVVGATATGIYNFSGGTAIFNHGMMVGATGAVNQSGASSLTSDDETIVYSGGTYTMAGATATFNSATAGGTALDLLGTLNLNAGTVSVPQDGLAGSGRIVFGGGTLKLTAGTAAVPTTAFTYNFAGSAIGIDGNFTGGTSVIDASTSGLTTFTFANALSGVGGIILVGDAGVQAGGTVFNFASEAGGPPATNTNTYLGVTGIIGGTLNAFGEDIAQSSGLIIGQTGTPGTLNLALDGSLNYGGTISGNGNLNVNFTGAGETLALTNPGNSFTAVNIELGDSGPTATVIPGTLQVFSGTYGTISDNGTGSGVIIGSATPGSGTVTFGATTYTGGTTINSGYTLNAQNLDGAVTNDANAILNVATSIGGDVANSGLLVAPTIGTSAANTLTNAAGGSVYTTTVNSTFSNSGSLGSTAFYKGGALSGPGAPTVTINGPFTQTASGTFFEDLAGTSHDLYQVNSSAALDGTVTLTGATAVGQQTIVVMDATGGVSGALAPNTVSALLSIVPNSIVVAGDTVTLTTNQQAISAFIAPFGATPNEISTANAIDSTSNNVLKRFFNRIGPGRNAAPTMIAATAEISPQNLQYSRTISIENGAFMVQRVDGICSNLQSGFGGLDTSAVSVVAPGFESGTGRSLGSLLAENDPGFHSAAPNGVNYYPGESGRSSPSPSEQEPVTPVFDSSRQVISDTPNPYLADVHPGGPSTPKMSEFIGGDVVLADLNQNQSVNAPSSKASYTAGDVTAGVGFRMTSHLAAGVLFDYNHTDADVDSNGSKIKVNSYAPGLFATYFDHGFYANGLFSFGYNQYSNTRNMPAIGSTATSSPNGEQYVANLSLGYDFHPDKNWVVGPTLGATYTHLDIDSFTETGAGGIGADQSVNSQSIDSVRTRLGAHAIYQTYTGDVLLQPNLSIMWQHEYIDDNYPIVSSLSDIGSSSFTTQTIASGEDTALISVGLTATLSNSLALYLNYLADVGANDYYAQSVVGGLKARF